MATAIIVAAGSSRRMGFDKLSTPLTGRPVLERTIDAFQHCDAVSRIIVVTSGDRIEWVEEQRDGYSKLSAPIAGGSERHFSVWNGIQALDEGCELVAVHDGARPLIHPDAIAACLAKASETGAASCARPVTDTMKRANADGVVTDPVDRTNLWAMETPQAFNVEVLRSAYERALAADEHLTDEVSAVQAAGTEVHLVASEHPNPKITFPGDIAIAEKLLR